MKVASTILFMIVLCAPAAAQETKPAPPPVPGLIEVVASEKIEGGVYTNAFLGLRLPITDGWSVVEDETKKQIIEAGKQYLKPTDAKQQADMDKSITNTAVLLTLFQSPRGEPIQSGLLLVVEKLPVAEIPATPYVAHLKELLTRNSTLNYAVEQDVHEETINGQTFVALDVFSTSGDIRVNQKYGCQMRKGFAVCFIETYGTETQLAALNKLVGGLTFK